MNKIFTIVAITSLCVFASCGNADRPQEERSQLPQTPVEVTTIHKGIISNHLTLFGSTVYLKRNVVTSPIPAFITDVHIRLGDHVNKGDVLYDLETKERRALGHKAVSADTSLSSFGRIKVLASFSGIISTLDKQQLGDYILEGSQLCTIAESYNLSVQINVPFEYAAFVKPGRACMLRLPDNREVSATITTPLTTMNAVSQTQIILAKPNTFLFLPENLIVKVILTTSEQRDTNLLPKTAVLTDEMMQEYWVMKMLNDSIAIKIPVKTGDKSIDEIQILAPIFQPDDRILVKGNYGLPDTARVVIVK